MSLNNEIKRKQNRISNNTQRPDHNRVKVVHKSLGAFHILCMLQTKIKKNNTVVGGIGLLVQKHFEIANIHKLLRK